MISPITNQVYSVFAMTNSQGERRRNLQSGATTQQHSQNLKLHDATVKVSISDDVKGQYAAQGEKQQNEKVQNNLQDDGSKRQETEKLADKDINEKSGSEPAKRNKDDAPNEGKEKRLSSETELSIEEKEKLQKLKRLDQEIRIHEHLHATVGGSQARGGPTFRLVLGPDGQQYAVSGHVNIEVSKGATPEETIRKAQQIKAAATAPLSPSSADLTIAAQATLMETRARAALTQKMLKRGNQSESTASDKPIADHTQSDMILSLLGAVPAPTSNSILHADQGQINHGNSK